MDGMRGLDAWITSGRYSKEMLRVKCSECDEYTSVTAETEYGATDWDRDACFHCGAAFEGDEDTELDEPPEPDIHYEDRYEEER